MVPKIYRDLYALEVSGTTFLWEKYICQPKKYLEKLELIYNLVLCVISFKISKKQTQAFTLIFLISS